MKSTKYIVYETYSTSEMVIFGATQEHAQVALKLGVKPVSAGFLNFNIEKDEYGQNVPVANAYGESVSLDIKSRPEIDSHLANRILSIGKHF